MSTTQKMRNAFALTTAFAAAIALSACSSNDPLASPDQDNGATIVVGSQAYYSNEIIAEIYAQALENDGFTVDRKFNIGQRDAYMPELESGAISLFPEYTGNLLQYFDSETLARSSADVYGALKEALPEGLTVLDQATASDQDSYTVTGEFAQEHSLASISDLADISIPLTLGGPPELAERPYGPTGLKTTYGIDVDFSATGDTTVEDLVAGTVNVANVYTADPRIETENLVVLEDPESLFLASNVVPLVNADIAAEVAETINAVSAQLTPEGLVSLNVQSTVEEKSPAVIATDWLSANGLS
ncbi:ABC transporter substrate-binding protein [Populibacterium corticicola]|jgi:osmoprotectant transport system substrate-binding protein|uniref:ABC transporter substrate-binding protein n=1 Tax=Populibacterium corticicola TaxID=1812826 RepID=A0ABW5XDT0_9MICO